MLHVHKEKGYKDKEANEQSWGGEGRDNLLKKYSLFMLKNLKNSECFKNQCFNLSISMIYLPPNFLTESCSFM